MPTTADIEYFVVSGTLAAMAAFNAAVNAAVDAGYAPLVEPHTDGTGIWQVMVKGAAASFISTYVITAVVVGPPSTLTIAGDWTQNFNPGYKFTITGSTGNDGVWTVQSSVFGAATVITIKETLPDATVDGIIVGDSPSVGP
ncbi:MAG: hypothetical protein E4H14_05030 [Candidatus Thorarchaeota archaeon]|nr:MAG: hypothetical protein E4H14_05030 [Candidatus Thorarchaeota archaeon]